MNNKKKQIDQLPEEFGSYEEAAEFWDNHDTTDYDAEFEDELNPEYDFSKMQVVKRGSKRKVPNKDKKLEKPNFVD